MKNKPHHKYYKVSGNKEIGRRLVIPQEAYLIAGEPRCYTCWYNGDGTIVYIPVKDEAHP